LVYVAKVLDSVILDLAFSHCVILNGPQILS
jgi:hypothetical protein